MDLVREALLGLLGLPLVFFLPGACWLGRTRRAAGWLTKAFLLSLLLNVAVLTAFKALFGWELNRWHLLASCVFVSAPSFIRPRVPAPSGGAGGVAPLFAGAALVAALSAVLFPKIFLESFSGDGVQHFAFVDSLRTHVLPYWDLENGRFGFNPGSFTFAYVGLLSRLLVGGVESSVRLPALVLLLPLLLLILDFVPEEKRSPRLAALAAAALFLTVFQSAFYGTWERGFADIASPTAHDLIAVYLVVAAQRFLEEGEQGWFLTAGLLAAFSYPGGLPLMLLTLFAWRATAGREESRGRFVLSFLGALVAVWAVVRLYLAAHPVGETEYSLGHLIARYGGFDFARGALNLKYLALMSAGGVFLAPAFAGKDRQCRALIVVAFGYAFLMALQERPNPHYFLAPAILLIPATLRGISLRPSRAGSQAAYLALLAAALLCSWPARYLVDTRSRNVGASLRVIAGDYAGQVEAAKALYALPAFRGLSHHALVHYANLSGCRVGECATVAAPVGTRLDGYRPVADGVFMKDGVVPPSSEPAVADYCPRAWREICRR